MFVLFNSISCSNKEGTVTILIPETVASWALKPLQEFSYLNQIRVDFIQFSNEGAILNYLDFSSHSEFVDLVFFVSDGYRKIIQSNMSVKDSWLLDYGYLVTVGQKNLPLYDLFDLALHAADGAWINPLTSTTGQDFFLFTVLMLGDKWPSFWKQVKENANFMVSTWAEAYSLYETGQVRWFLTYFTDNVYRHYNNMPLVSVYPLNQGWYRQNEYGIALSESPEVQILVEYTQSEAFQKYIPQGNWMLPALPHVKLPVEYTRILPDIDNTKVCSSKHLSSDEISMLLRQWQDLWQE
jgi:ABC-type thiamine transport system substrate-binding protein